MCNTGEKEYDSTLIKGNISKESIPSYVRSKKILIVEDNDINRQMLCMILEDEYETVQAENGKKALEMLEQYGEEIILILLDIIMPEMDGYTFLSIMKQDSRYANIPVIVVTLNDSEEEEVKALSRGASDFIIKPYRPQVVKNRVASIIKLRETAAMVNLMKNDHLTGVYNKEYFYKKAEGIIQNNQDKNYDVICSNMENFSLINDMFGYSIGDELLCYVAERLAEFVKGRGIVSRINADVFAVLVEHQEDYNEKLFEPLILDVNEWFDRTHLDMDFGIYHIEPQDLSMNIACDRAILAIESIKGKFAQNYAFYDEDMRRQKLNIQTIASKMKQALQEKEFKAYYQPKYSLKSGAIVGAEALVRWISPEDGFMSPGEFIPIFEKNRFITQLDKYVWEEVCILIRICMDHEIPVVPVSVNVSHEDLYEDDLPEFFLGLVEKYGLGPKALHLEVTESVYTENPEAIIERVSRLREYGFVIEMDDFGKGSSSLNMLSELPIDILKLDMNFVQSNANDWDANGKNIISFVIMLAKWMNLTVTAEGVETKEQAEKLRDMECDNAQGYYFARPMPQAEFVEMLRNSKNHEVAVNSDL